MLVDYQKVQIFQADNHILQNVDFKVDEGEFIYIYRVQLEDMKKWTSLVLGEMDTIFIRGA